MRIPYISLIAAGALTLGGCAYGDIGLGYGAGYGGYGYDYGSPYYGAGYGDPYGAYGGYGGYGGYGWYDNYYYPGTGYYVYDSYRRPHRWSDRQRSYWMSRQQALSRSGTPTATTTTNWSGFRNRASQPTTTTTTTTTTEPATPRRRRH